MNKICQISLLLVFFVSGIAQSKNNTIDTLDIDTFMVYPPRLPNSPYKQVATGLQPVIIPVSPLLLEPNYWRNWLSVGINFKQNTFSDNWTGGGVSSIALGGQFNYKTDRLKDEQNFVSEIILQYGKLRNKGQLERKTNDRIFWDNKISLKIADHWNFFGSLNFESQFDRGYNYTKNTAGDEIKTLISKFMAPGYVTESLGFEYKPNTAFWLRFGTGTARQTLVLDKNIYLTNPKNFGVEPGKTYRNEVAFQFVGNFERNIMQNVSLKSRYTAFANYEKLKNIDQRLDLSINLKVNHLINVILSGIAIYDDDASDKIQATQGLSIELGYKYPR